MGCTVADGVIVQLIDEVTGGILKAKPVEEVKLYRPETALVRGDEAARGVTSVTFEAQMPDQ